MGQSIDLTIIRVYEVNQAQQIGRQLVEFETAMR